MDYRAGQKIVCAKELLWHRSILTYPKLTILLLSNAGTVFHFKIDPNPTYVLIRQDYLIGDLVMATAAN
jgi:hypothetical protein